MSKINKLRPFFYGLAELGPASIDIFIKVYLLAYFDLVKGLSPTLASIAIGLSVFWDALIDPAIGTFSDRYYSKNGHRKLPLQLATVLMSLSFILIWFLPQGSDLFMFTSLFIVSALLNSSLALFSIPYIAVANDLEKNNLQRQKWIGWRVAFLNIGSLIGLFTAALFMSKESSALQQSSYTMPVFILSVITFIICSTSVYLMYKSKSIVIENNQDLKPLRIKDIFYDLQFIQLLCSFFIVYCGIGLNSTLALYYYREYLQLPEQQIQVILVSFLVFFTFALPLWIFISRYIEQKKLIITGGLLLGISTCLIYPNISSQSFLIVFFLASVLGGLLVGVAVILETYLSEYLNLKELNLKRSVSGQYLVLWKMAQKVSRAVAVGLSGPILAYSENNPQKLANFFGYGVGLFFILSALIMIKKIDSTSTKIE